MDIFWIGGEGPHEIPQQVYLYLVTGLNVPADNLTGLVSVQKPGFHEGKPVTFIRIYHPKANEKTVPVKNFDWLDDHPELIIYEGYWDSSAERVFMERRPPKPSATPGA